MINPPRPYGVLEEEEHAAHHDLPSLHGLPRHTQFIPITTKQKLYVLGMQGVGSGLVNVVINLAVAYAMYHNIPNNTIAFAGNLTCVVSDVIMTAFLIPCLTGIIGTALIRNDLRVGKLITPIDCRYLTHPLCKRIPTGQSWIEIVKRSILFGFIGIVLFAPVTLLIIYFCTGTEGMHATWSYIAFKGYWSGLVAMILSPPIAFIAIAQLRPENYVESGINYGDMEYTSANVDGFVPSEDEEYNHHSSEYTEHVGSNIQGPPQYPLKQ